MNCPKCSSRNLRMYYSVPFDDINCTHKRMICGDCQERFNAVQLIADVRVKSEEADSIVLPAEYAGRVFFAEREPK